MNSRHDSINFQIVLGGKNQTLGLQNSIMLIDPPSLSSSMIPDDFFLFFFGSWAMCAPMFMPEKSFEAEGNMTCGSL